MNKKIEIFYTEWPDEDSATDIARLMLTSARKAAHSAYAPYSGFKVGAAIMLANGTVVSGSNQENMAYPSGLCAERVALFSAGAQFPDIAVIAVGVTAMAMGHALHHPIAPCGACRQVMLETEMRQGSAYDVFLQGTSGPVICFSSIRSLLPLHFREDILRPA